MRISGGKARGVKLSISKSGVHRPAMDKLRQSIFSSIGAHVDGARVCDLFAGTGSYGLEALSRGASMCVFVENHRQACQMIRDNIVIVAKSMAVPTLDTQVLPLDVSNWAPKDEPFDLVFVDPPYEVIQPMSGKLFKLFESLVAEDGIVAFEMPGNVELHHPKWTLRKRFGKGAHSPTICLYART